MAVTEIQKDLANKGRIQRNEKATTLVIHHNGYGQNEICVYVCREKQPV